MQLCVKLLKSEIERLVEEIPGLPDDYLRHLSEIGWGEQLNGRIVYGRPTCPTEIFGVRVNNSPNWLLGDDGMGYCLGYDTTRQVYGEYSESGGWEPWPSSEGFEAFLK
ncbi:hypothetical protein Pla108_06870 [Botrimarina colliarenosi]|uniref:Knr4/Smi1-like domain-containing protein n=1 Tax=Botrimarina colliarenosi TaxID=2528001 RepID=A0A5C6AIB6_9BACT|nr:hypothetical protein Pla108_06870 [Botrimarina colliarenosi]